MSSQGTASDISRQEADDLLQRLITEAIKVRAVFVGCGSVCTTVCGFVTRKEDGLILITEGTAVTNPSFLFGLKDATFRYGDTRAFSANTPRLPGTPRFASALVLTYPDGGQVALFEILRSR